MCMTKTELNKVVEELRSLKTLKNETEQQIRELESGIIEFLNETAECETVDKNGKPIKQYRGSIMNANNKNYSIRPLTEEERVFAEEHYSLFFYIMRNNLHLDPEEWYDILIIPYLDAVKKYHEYESARKYAFGTVLKNKLYTAFTNELRKRRSKKVIPDDKLASLDYMLEGDNPFAKYRVEDWWIDKKINVERQVILKGLFHEFYNKCIYCDSDAWGDDHINDYLKCELDLLLKGYTRRQTNKETEKIFNNGYSVKDLDFDLKEFRKIFKEVFGI